MAKDYAKFVPPKQRYTQQKPKGAEIFFIFLLVLVICAASGYFLFQKNLHGSPILTDRTLVFLHLKKAPPKPVVVKLAKNTINKTPAEPQVQFDFYSELPNMQVTLSEPAQGVKGLTQLIPAKPKVIAAADPVSEPANLAQGTLDAPLANKHSVIFNTAEVDNLLEAETRPVTSAHTQPYVIQLGVFESETGAQRLVEALKSVGFEPEIVKITLSGREMYQVTQGPFSNRELAKLTQQRLQKRGIISIIRQTAQG
jgi:cell division protein FtsN